MAISLIIAYSIILIGIFLIGIFGFFLAFRGPREDKAGKAVLSTDVTQPRKIKETKCICQACGNIWYYGKVDLEKNIADQKENKSIQLDNLGTDLMCCGGCWPALFMPKRAIKDVKDLNKCPKCNSSAVKKEEVVHEV